MEKPLSMLLLTLGGFIAASILLATVFPAITQTGNSIASERTAIGTQSLQEIAVANALSELDGTGAGQDTDTDTYFDIWAWVNNTGLEPLPLARMVKDAPDAPLEVPFHPAAERVWRSLGYLS